ncbi:MAG: bifunctional (p)ppGpp synthetase/guanosine-3',5'-bis(diphosphate) 3'-pyrophosphohydrolase [Burkholderiales bacterium]|nr:bifunctional (p)ppGpp synthetase/guanosine-3',5'-bis(diphosphate) 3'-pyrophosphohydrolase [Burkholderiales bacterium]
MVETAAETHAEADALIAAWRGAGARVDAAAVPVVERALAALAGEPVEIVAGAKDSAALLARLKLDVDSIVAALLAVTAVGRLPRATLAERFGAGIAGLVEGAHRMDDIQQLRPGLGTPKQTDHGAQLEALRQMLLAMVQDARVVLIKLAGEVSLLRRLAREGTPAERTAAVRDTFDLLAPLANRLGVWQLKWELEDLAFRCEQPETYKSIASELDGKRGDREAFIIRVATLLREELKRAGIQAEVSGRPKHIYSIWKKMQRKDLGFKDLFDVRAVRVLVDDVAECYTALGVVHNLWTPIPKEFDDYIAKPKANDYRSLHTAVIGPDDKVLEVQIRTREMHQANELGIAAHWRYKEGGRRDAHLEETVAWMRRILDWRDDVGGAADLAESVRTELFRETVYVLTPQGRVVALPSGSTPVDFAYHVHTDLGHRCRGAKVNGHIVPLNCVLATGQRVEIVTAREGGPSRDWLNPQLGFIRSHRARAKVRAWFNAQHLDQDVAHGRTTLEREVHRLGVAAPPLETLATALGYAKPEELLAGLGRGEVTQRQLQTVLRPATTAPVETAEPGTPVVRAPAARHGDVLVVGVDKLLTQLARCCKPAPPDPIVGFVTLGRGISIHRAACPNVARLSPERRVVAEWGEPGRESRFPVDLEVIGDATGTLLRDVTDVLGKERAPVRAARASERGLDARLDLTVEVSGGDQLARVCALIRDLPAVASVRRR